VTFVLLLHHNGGVRRPQGLQHILLDRLPLGCVHTIQVHIYQSKHWPGGGRRGKLDRHEDTTQFHIYQGKHRPGGGRRGKLDRHKDTTQFHIYQGKHWSGRGRRGKLDRTPHRSINIQVPKQSPCYYSLYQHIRIQTDTCMYIAECTGKNAPLSSHTHTHTHAHMRTHTYCTQCCQMSSSLYHGYGALISPPVVRLLEFSSVVVNETSRMPAMVGELLIVVFGHVCIQLLHAQGPGITGVRTKVLTTLCLL